MKYERILLDVSCERERQERLCAEGKFPWTCAAPLSAWFKTADGKIASTEPAKLAVLAEEFGEVAREVTEAIIDPTRRDRLKLRAELIQIAAVAVAWVEALDAEAPSERWIQLIRNHSNGCAVIRLHDGAPCTRPAGHSGAHIHEEPNDGKRKEDYK